MGAALHHRPRRHEKAGRLRDGGDGGEAVRRVEGVVVGGRGRARAERVHRYARSSRSRASATGS